MICMLTEVRVLKPGELFQERELDRIGRTMMCMLTEVRVLKPGELFQERELDRIGRTITLLRNDQLGDVLLVFRNLVLTFRVVIGSIDKRNDVGVLLNRTRLAKIGHHRSRWIS